MASLPAAPRHVMTALAALRPARRLQLGMLVLWLCCLGAATAAPWLAKSPFVAATCGTHHDDVGSAGHRPGSDPGDGLQCPNCLPMGAPPPVHLAAFEADFPALAVPASVAAPPFLPNTAARPPARAPPQHLSI